MGSSRLQGIFVTRTAAVLGSVVASTIAGVGITAGPAQASTAYSCPLVAGTVCVDPLAGSLHGDVSATSDGYSFDLNSDGSAGYIKVDGSSKISMTTFPVSFSVQVKGVGVPSTKVGDYDVVRGTPGGNWKIEVVARNNRTTSRALCFFKGANGKANVVGGPDLSSLSGWTKITCTDTGSAVQLAVGGTVVNSKTVKTGSIPNPGPLLIGAKDTSGGDQYSGYAKDIHINGS
jgi:Concanavalin A-like lectin/glucanases superfamily